MVVVPTASSSRATAIKMCLAAIIVLIRGFSDQSRQLLFVRFEMLRMNPMLR